VRKIKEGIIQKEAAKKGEEAKEVAYGWNKDAIKNAASIADLSQGDAKRVMQRYRTDDANGESPVPLRKGRFPGGEERASSTSVQVADLWLSQSAENRSLCTVQEAQVKMSDKIKDLEVRQGRTGRMTGNLFRAQGATQRVAVENKAKVEGFDWNYPSEEIREEVVMKVIKEQCGMDSRDVTDIDMKDRTGNLPPHVTITFRNGSRANNFYGVAFSREHSRWI